MQNKLQLAVRQSHDVMLATFKTKEAQSVLSDHQLARSGNEPQCPDLIVHLFCRIRLFSNSMLHSTDPPSNRPAPRPPFPRADSRALSRLCEVTAENHSRITKFVYLTQEVHLGCLSILSQREVFVFSFGFVRFKIRPTA